jgi:hypothetical protein
MASDVFIVRAPLPGVPPGQELSSMGRRCVRARGLAQDGGDPQEVRTRNEILGRLQGLPPGSQLDPQEIASPLPGTVLFQGEHTD